MGDEGQLRRMIMELAALPLHAIEPGDPCPMSYACKFSSFRLTCDNQRLGGAAAPVGHYEHLMSTLQVVLESPLAEVFRSLKVVSLNLDAP